MCDRRRKNTEARRPNGRCILAAALLLSIAGTARANPTIPRQAFDPECTPENMTRGSWTECHYCPMESRRGYEGRPDAPPPRPPPSLTAPGQIRAAGGNCDLLRYAGFRRRCQSGSRGVYCRRPEREAEPATEERSSRPMLCSASPLGGSDPALPLMLASWVFYGARGRRRSHPGLSEDRKARVQRRLRRLVPRGRRTEGEPIRRRRHRGTQRHRVR